MTNLKGSRALRSTLIVFFIVAGLVVAVTVAAGIRSGSRYWGTSEAHATTPTASQAHSPSTTAAAKMPVPQANSLAPASHGLPVAATMRPTEQPATGPQSAAKGNHPTPRTPQTALTQSPKPEAKAGRPAAAEPAREPASQKATGSATSLSRAFRTAAESVLPSVVTIQHTLPALNEPTSGHGGAGSELGGSPFEGLLPDPLLRHFFEGMPPIARGPEESLGSGVIIDSSGIILTNDHVVDGGGKIMVRLHDGRQIEASEVKTDPRTDLAVVKIKAPESLAAARLGDSGSLQIGDWVIAVGNPFGLSETVTAGIISAKGRGLGITDREEFLQTDAAINPGNSGGPLVDLQGEVVGINTAISSTTGGYQGVGFAIPINLAKWVSRQLIHNGKVDRAYLGVGIQQLTPDLASQFGLKETRGVVVTQVYPDSPASTAGLKAGDVILRLDNHEVAHPREIQSAIEEAHAGTPHTLTVVRDQKQISLQVTVREQPTEFGRTTESRPEWGNSRGERFQDLGIAVGPLTEQAASELGLKGIEGVVIVAVEPGSLAAEAGLAPSMVISRVGQTPVKNVEQFREAMKHASLQKGVLLLVHSHTGSAFVVIEARTK
jgi:serine protease Do